jgi:putative peptidoglycan lipid II flippase
MSRTIAKASLIWGLSIALSRVVGLVRDAVFARTVGATGDADAYFAAFVVPDFLNYLLAAGALSIVFIPIVGGYLARGEDEKGWAAFSAIASFVSVLLGVLTIFLWVGMPFLAPLIAPGFVDEAQRARLIELTRIVLPAQLFHVIGGLLAAALQARDKHGLAALAPLVYNVLIIAGGLAGGATHGAEGFAWGVLAGSALGPFLLPWLGCRRIGLRWRFALDFRHPDLRRYLARSVPIMIGFSIVVVDDWLLRREGSRLGTGAVSAISYAKKLMLVPVGIFGFAAGVAAYPTLARLAAAEKLTELRGTLVTTLRSIALFALASQAYLMVASLPLTVLVLGRRKLLPETLREIAACLVFFAFGVIAWSLQSVLARGFYAIGNTWLPAVTGTLVALGALPLYMLAGTSGTKALAGVSSLAILAYVFVLAWLLVRRLPKFERAEWIELRTFVFRAVAAFAVGWSAGVILVLLLPEPGTFVGAAIQTGLFALFVFGGFAIVGDKLGITEIRGLRELVLRKLGLSSGAPGPS